MTYRLAQIQGRPLTPISSTAAPTVAGTASYGSVLTCTTGSWTGTPISYSYQWRRAGIPVGGPSTTYTIGELDAGAAIDCQVTAIGPGGVSGTATSSNSITAQTFIFVSKDGSNGNNGASTVTPVLTLARAASLNASGKTVVLRCGDRWFETISLVTGSAIGAYGAAPTFDSEGYRTNAPILDGGETVAGPWTSYDGSVTDIEVQDHFTGTSGTTLTSHTPNIGQSWLKHQTSLGNAQIGASNTLVRSTTNPAVYYAQPGHAGNFRTYAQLKCVVSSIITGDLCSVYNRMQTSRASEINAYFFRLGADGSLALAVTVANSTTALTPTLPAGTVTVNAGDVFTLLLQATGSFAIDGAAQLTGLLYNSVGTLIQTMTATDTTSGVLTADDPGTAGFRLGGSAALTGVTTSNALQIDDFEMGPLDHGTATNTYKATYAGGTSGALLIDYKGQYARGGLNQNSLNNREWFWKSNVLYIRDDSGAPGSTDVISAATTSPGVTLNTNCIAQDVACEHFAGQSIMVQGNNSTVRRCYAQRSSGTFVRGLSVGLPGVFRADTTSGATFDQCVLRDCQSDFIYFGGTQTSPTATFNKVYRVYGFGADLLQIASVNDGLAVGSQINDNYMDYGTGSTDSVKGGIICFGGSHTFLRNTIKNANYAIIGLGSNVTARNNFIYKCGQGIVLSDLTTGTIVNWTVDHNVLVECNNALRIKTNTSSKRTGMVWVANTVYNSAVQPYPLQAAGINRGSGAVSLETGVDGQFTDNIIRNLSGGGLTMLFTSVASGGAWVSDYNDLGPEYTNFIRWAGTNYSTIAAFRTGTSQGAHSIVTDPLFANAGGTTAADYALAGGSPAIGTGTTVTTIVTNSNMGAMASVASGSGFGS